MLGRSLGALLVAAAAACLSCDKVPLHDINASFTVADASWFEDEETLFVFYRAHAEQGLGDQSAIEISWVTDAQEVPWTRLQDLPAVHTHLPVDCTPRGRCGSWSVRVPLPPRQVRLRLRYHPEGSLALDAPLALNLVGSGPAHTNRSLLVYGVMDATNTRVQWRARHQFPALRNEEVQELGLRRFFSVAGAAHGDVGPPPEGDPYGYAFAPGCPATLTPLGWAAVETTDRAIFDSGVLPLTAATSPAVCAPATVTDAKGTFTAPAVAQKNPETHPAFPSLHSPIRENTAVGFLLHPCNRTISDPHLGMQEQRMLLDGAMEICLDGWRDPGFADGAAAIIRARADAVRAQGADMVLTLAVHHDVQGGALGQVLEQVLETALAPEAGKSSPRVSGAFVFDSFQYATARPAVSRLALWCPADLGDDLDLIPDTSSRQCPLLPDLPDLQLGPFHFGNLPILPTRKQYLSFIDRYSEAQAGRMKALVFLAPERTPLSQNVEVEPFGVATFFNNELVTAQPADAFSYCAGGDPLAFAVVFRIPPLPQPLPLQALPQVHSAFPQPQYPLGLIWDFPFLTRATYEVVIAGSATAFSLTVPFGVGIDTEAYYGNRLWEAPDIALSHTLLQCTRFCDAPTFDSSGVYNVTALFRPAYQDQCYRPSFPEPGDAGGGFPRDP
ncbi:MAG TPA: hypothetical protein VIG99_09025 [Myxococcaceae bacterium]